MTLKNGTCQIIVRKIENANLDLFLRHVDVINYLLYVFLVWEEKGVNVPGVRVVQVYFNLGD